MFTSVRLVDGTREMVLLPREGLRLQGHDVPMPAVREVTEERTDDDGEDDTTELHGATSCSRELFATQTPAAFEEELGRFLHPRSRPYLVAADDEWSQERRLRLRISQFGGPRGVDLPRTTRRIQAQWKVPDGIWESADLVEETVNADIVTESVGFTLPVTLPVTLAATTGTGTSQISNVGGTPVHHVTRLYGPCAGPRLVNETLDEEITFTDSLVLGSGEYVEIDTRARSAYLDSNTSLSRLSDVDYTVSSWWQIEPGDQLIRYAPSAVMGAAAAVITYRPAWLT
jgi:hypothetical protein